MGVGTKDDKGGGPDALVIDRNQEPARDAGM